MTTIPERLKRPRCLEQKDLPEKKRGQVVRGRGKIGYSE